MSANRVVRRPRDSFLVAILFVAAFVVAYLAVPFNPTVPNTQIQVRPEPLVLILAIPFGRSAVVGSAGGVLVHNAMFRLGPEITPLFTIAQTAMALVAGLFGTEVWRHAVSPLRQLLTPAAFVGVFAPTLGILSAVELGANPSEEILHIFEEVLIPQLLIGPLGLAGLEFARTRLKAPAPTAR
ncbi:MAG: hypothetical protein ACT4OI_06215 [Methanobacteriota archaeon]